MSDKEIMIEHVMIQPEKYKHNDELDKEFRKNMKLLKKAIEAEKKMQKKQR